MRGNSETITAGASARGAEREGGHARRRLLWMLLQGDPAPGEPPEAPECWAAAAATQPLDTEVKEQSLFPLHHLPTSGQILPLEKGNKQ